MSINIITLDGNILNSISGYTINDVGSRVSKMKAVGTDTIYFNDKGYRDGFKEIKVDGMDMKSTVEIIEGLHTSGNPINLVDLFGNTYSGIVSNFNSNYLKTKDAYGYSFNFIVFPSGAIDSYLFRVGGTLVYVVESCSVEDRGNSYNQLNLADGNVGYQINSYTSHTFTINMSGIELVTSGIGNFTNTLTDGALTDITLPNGRQFKGLLISKNISLLEGNSDFQNYTLSFIAGVYVGANPPTITIIDNAGSNLNALYENYSIQDNSERFTKHVTFKGIAIQKLTPDEDDKEINITYLIHKNGVDPAPSGTIVDITIGANTFHGIIGNRSEDILESSINIKRVTFTLIVVPE